MGFTNLWPLFLLLTIPPVIMLYILKRKYKEEVISSSLLWKEVYKNTRANTPWEKFKKNIMTNYNNFKCNFSSYESFY